MHENYLKKDYYFRDPIYRIGIFGISNNKIILINTLMNNTPEYYIYNNYTDIVFDPELDLCVICLDGIEIHAYLIPYVNALKQKYKNIILYFTDTPESDLLNQINSEFQEYRIKKLKNRERKFQRYFKDTFLNNIFYMVLTKMLWCFYFVLCYFATPLILMFYPVNLCINAFANFYRYIYKIKKIRYNWQQIYFIEYRVLITATYVKYCEKPDFVLGF